ncbi:hypothetical protein [Enterococcus faecium]|uniref:hypothetical protein n=1 Tax=Enterococcus faecium TaxID=1352 RepID=UPI000BF21A7E|nr:hypothetical protein [Enterococcus faecium]PEH48043.1 hypothetical protein CRM75_09080 [Enterococcus faecium]PEH48085.1 hypothetical protein CRM75_09380 [Enterococcus faecium]PEH48924.1 hypothetical protein CRM75_14025 [Enterococcus faecium]
MKFVDLNVRGIKCDNPECEYSDMAVKCENYPQWLNKPCPKCGTNLLTQEDLDATEQLMEIVNLTNEILKDSGLEKQDMDEFVIPVEANGTGELSFGEIKKLEEEK